MSIFRRPVAEPPSAQQVLETVANDLTQPLPQGAILRSASYLVAKPVPPWFNTRLAAMASFHGFVVREAADQRPDTLGIVLVRDSDPR